MRYDVFLIKKIGTELQFEEKEEILGQVVASNPEEAKQAARESFKEARGKQINVREAPNKKGMWV